MTARLRVIKLGGSLLDWSELPARFLGWLEGEPEAVNVVVVGGGPMVDALRELDARLKLPPDAVHWTAIRVMDLMAELFAARLARATLVRDWRQLSRAAYARLQVLCVESFLREDAKSRDALPCGWEVTSDSIAARVAVVLKAHELVLLKSTSPGSIANVADWIDEGMVDAYFSRALAGTPVRIVNLRESSAPVSELAGRRRDR